MQNHTITQMRNHTITQMRNHTIRDQGIQREVFKYL
jgi:hypothetical protein